MKVGQVIDNISMDEKQQHNLYLQTKTLLLLSSIHFLMTIPPYENLRLSIRNTEAD